MNLMSVPFGRQQMQPVPESCCQMVSLLSGSPRGLCQNCRHQLFLCVVFLWSSQEPSIDMYLWIPLHYRNEIPSRKYQNQQLWRSYLLQAVNFQILDPCEVSLVNGDIASHVQYQGLISGLDWEELNVALADGEIFSMSPRPNTRWLYKIQVVSYKLQQTERRKSRIQSDL